LSDKVVLTSDNPKMRDPDLLSDGVGVAAENYKKVLTITDRKQAIKTACQLAQ
jgi:UDP-N-acetylmuramoyl-L-alanyl-D-glutamate--2,6-diaminopimelate ligase